MSTPDKIFACEMCQINFKSDTSLTRHIAQKHKVKDSSIIESPSGEIFQKYLKECEDNIDVLNEHWKTEWNNPTIK